jgi:hypothetical protein
MISDSPGPEVSHTLSRGAALLALALGILMWPAIVVGTVLLFEAHHPPSRHLLTWLYAWQWWLAVIIVGVSGAICLLGYAARRSLVRDDHAGWGRTIARAAIRLAAAAGLVALLVLITVSASARVLAKFRWGICHRDAININLALQMYLADNDGYFPPADTWADATLEYLKNWNVLICPERPDLRLGYALNSALAGQRAPRVTETTRHIVVLLESDRGWNATGGPDCLPALPRHGNGDVYGLLDGRVVWEPRLSLGTDEQGHTIYAREDASGYLVWDLSTVAPKAPDDDAGEGDALGGS